MPKEMELKAFLAVCKTLNFTKAADSLYLSQQACSRYVHNLEEEVGFPLLVRTTRKVTTTPEGEMLYQVLTEASQNYENVLRIGRARASMEKSTVRIGVMNMTSMDFVTEHYQRFQGCHPDVSIIWNYKDPGPLMSLLKEDAIDLAILHLSSDGGESILADPEYRTMKLKSCKMYLKYSRFHPLAKTAVRPSDFDGAVIGSFKHSNESISEEVFRMKRRLETFGLRNNVVQVFDSLEEANISIQLGETIGLASELSLFLRDVDTEAMCLGEGTPLSCVWKAATQNSFVKLFVDALTENNS